MAKLAPPLCAFDVTVRFEATGLLGGTREYEPHLAVNASFGAYKKRRRWPLSVTGSQKRERAALGAQGDKQEHYAFDDEVKSYASAQQSYTLHHRARETCADESLTFEVVCRTRNFGLGDLDARQSRFTHTHNTCGHVQLELYDLMRAYTQSGGPPRMTVSRPLLDLKLVELKAQELRRLDGGGGAPLSQSQWNAYVEEAAEVTQKGVLHFDLVFRHFDARAYAGTVFAIRDLKSACTHSLHASALAESTGQLGAPLGHAHHDTHASGYEPLLYTSQRGQELMARRLEEHIVRPYCRSFIKLQESDPEPLCRPLNASVANLQLPWWISKMGKLPVAAYWSSMDAQTREYASAEKRAADLALYGRDARTERYFTRLLGSALRRYGMSAQRFEATVRTHFSLANKSQKLDPLFLVCEEVVADVGTFAANCAYYTSDYRFMREGRAGAGKTNSSVMVSLDSWDSTLMNDEGRGDDCEGLDNAAMHVIRSFLWGRADMTHRKWDSSLLQSVSLYLEHSALIDLGGTVTSAYFDTSNKPVELKQGDDLPMQGDAMDTRSKSDGHCFGLLCSLTDTLRRLEAGNCGEEVLAKVRAATLRDPAFLARDAQRTILLLEATGSIEPRIQPLEEAYALDARLRDKRKAERYWGRALRTAMKGTGAEDDLGDMFSCEGLQHYVEAQHPRRNISSFYKEIVHGSSVDLWKRFDISLSQFAFCRRMAPGSYAYGARIADYLRAPQDFALVCPFYEARAAWEAEVCPMMESVQHQLPLASFGTYTDEKYAQLHSSYIAPADLGAAYAFGKREGESPAAQLSFEKLAASVAESAHLSIVRLQSHDWHMQADDARTQRFKSRLAAMPGLVAHAFFEEHQLPVCEARLEILCIIDTNKALALKTIKS